LYTPVIPVPKRLRQKDHEFEDSLAYMVKPCLQNQKKNKQTKQDVLKGLFQNVVKLF
jgi:hypothetical protein